MRVPNIFPKRSRRAHAEKKPEVQAEATCLVMGPHYLSWLHHPVGHNVHGVKGLGFTCTPAPCAPNSRGGCAIALTIRQGTLERAGTKGSSLQLERLLSSNNTGNGISKYKSTSRWCLET